MRLNYFNFRDFHGKILLTNDFGDYLFLTKEEFENLVNDKVIPGSILERKLITSRMAYEGTNLAFSSLNAYNLREVKRYAATATSLHIFVITTACNLGCIYCQANTGKNCQGMFMDADTAERAVDISLQSPEKALTFEFQGGEPLLNFEIIKHVIEYAETHKGDHEITYNVVTNLTLLTDDILNFFIERNVGISTSIDGDQVIHDYNRPFRDGHGSFQRITERIQMVKKRGIQIGAIQTTTKTALHHANEIVDTYVKLGFGSIFVRPLTPLGKALSNWDEIGYTPEEFLEFYRNVLDEIISLNKNGIYFREEHAAIFIRKIMGNGINYMELRSPCGGGVGQIAYYADGRAFTCDEGRMLAEMGNDAFYLGDVRKNTFRDLITNSTCKAVCASSVLESIPSCCDCIYQPYCGVCPVVNYALYNDIIEKEPRSYKCKIYSGILDKVFELLDENSEEVIRILNSWRM